MIVNHASLFRSFYEGVIVLIILVWMKTKRAGVAFGLCLIQAGEKIKIKRKRFIYQYFYIRGE